MKNLIICLVLITGFNFVVGYAVDTEIVNENSKIEQKDKGGENETEIKRLGKERDEILLKLENMPNLGKLDEKLTLCSEYLNLNTELFKAYRKELLVKQSSEFTSTVKEILIKESAKEPFDTNLITELSSELDRESRSLNKNEFVKLKNLLSEVIDLYKEKRTQGRILYEVSKGNEEAAVSQQKNWLNQFVENESKENSSLIQESLRRLIELNENGDKEILSRFSEIMKTENRNFMIIDSKVTDIDEPVFMNNEEPYINIKSLKSIKNIFTIENLKENDKDKITISDSFNTLVITNEEIYLNESELKTEGFIIQSGGETYLKLQPLFQVFKYSTSWDSEMSIFSAKRAIFPPTEIDIIPTEELISGILDFGK